MIRLSAVLRAHEFLIREFGGSNGVRDNNLLESALNRPFATFDGIDLYPTAIDKAAALLESIIINHPFVDGNKRTAYALMEVLLRHGGVKLRASQEEKYTMVIKASTGEFRFDDVRNWLASHTTSKP